MHFLLGSKLYWFEYGYSLQLDSGEDRQEHLISNQLKSELVDLLR